MTLRRDEVCGRCLWVLEPELETCPNCGGWVDSVSNGSRVS